MVVTLGSPRAARTGVRGRVRWTFCARACASRDRPVAGARRGGDADVAPSGESGPMDPKETLHRYLRRQRSDLLAKLDGLGEYDVRRPMTGTGTNLLGLVKHVASVELGYFTDV